MAKTLTNDYISDLLSQLLGKFNVEIFWMYFRFICSGKIEGIENLPESPYILTANHVSYLDWIFLQALYKKKTNQNIVFISKKRLFKHSFFKYLVSYNGSICVENETFDKDVFENIRKAFDEKKVLGIFPEGRRSENGKLLKAKNGVAIIALLYGFHVVPVGLKGVFEALPKHRCVPRISKCTIKIGKPMFFDKKVENAFSDDNLLKITNSVMSEIASLSGQNYTY